MDIGTIIGLIVAGLIVGALGRLVNPGRDAMPIWATILLGIASVVLVGWLLGDGTDLGFWGYVIAVVIAAILVTVLQRFWPGRDRRATT